MVGMGASTDWKATDEAQRDSAISRMKQTHAPQYLLVMYESIRQKHLRRGHSIILYLYAILWENQFVRGGKKRKRARHALFNIRLAS